MGYTVIKLGEPSDGSAKDYMWSLDQHGLEMGIGKPGSYGAHAHRHYVDLIYSPTGLITPQVMGTELLVVQPRVRFGPTATGDFFFMKFLPSRGPYFIPDKVVGDELQLYSEDPKPLGYSTPWSGTYRYFAPSEDREFNVSIDLLVDRLVLQSSAGWGLSVEPYQPTSTTSTFNNDYLE
jgi:hypothetical protein